MNVIKIGNRIISNKHKPLVVAEIGINHFGSLTVAKKIVNAAKKSGAEAVKVQIHIPEEEMSEEAKKIKPGNSNKNIFKIIKENSLSLENEKKLKNYIEKKKLIYIATPFSYKAAKWLNKNNVKIFKIGSGECNNIPFIKYVCSFKKPMIISTGMNTLKDVKKTVNIVKKNKIPHALLHCVNIYPVKYNHIRLSRLIRMQKIFNKSIIGYSDHSIGNDIATAALGLGAKIIEKHFTLSNYFSHFRDHKISLNPKNMKNMVTAVRRIDIMLGDYDKKISKNEKKNFPSLRRSIYFDTNLKKGTILKRKHLKIVRPYKNIDPKDMSKVLGKKLIKNVEDSKLVTLKILKN